MDYVFVKDMEEFVVKKLKSQIEFDEIIISEAEYKKLSGDNYYEEKGFISHAREHNFDYKKVMEQNHITGSKKHLYKLL